jgi:hypothetical protein
LAAAYHVSVEGQDGNPGSAEQPWRTIQKAANTALPGDTVTVHAGRYDERVSTTRGGAGEADRIRFQADGKVIMRGWVVSHAYIAVYGFEITGHSSLVSTESFVKLNAGAHHFELSNCVIRDGFAFKRDDLVFTAPDQINSPAGGFLAAGFFPGQAVALRRGTNVALVNREITYTVAAVSDTTLTLKEGNIANDGPKPAYLSGSPNFALHFHGGVTNGVFRNNVFTNLSYIMVMLAGSNHLFEANTFVHNNGWDAMVLAGSDQVFHHNLFRDFGWGNYSPSPDILDNYGANKFERIVFTNNFIENIIGVISVQKALNTVVSGPLLMTHNVFTDVGFFWGYFPGTRIEQNTFLRVARQGNVAVQVERHALVLETRNYATNAVIRNNIFLDCGQATGDVPWSEVGWYRFLGPADSVTTEGNFVAGAPPDYGAKTTWPEGNPLLNGGDPRFVNINDPLGPDGLPFTEDDGLRLRWDSKLLGASAGGRTPGAYESPLDTRPRLEVQLLPAAQVRVSWPAAEGPWILQSAPKLLGEWADFPADPVLEDGQFHVSVTAADAAGYFRLSR